MPLRLDASDPNFDSAFTAFLATKREVSEDVEATVRGIIAQVRECGDKAVKIGRASCRERVLTDV